MESKASRLKEERKRSGLNQEEFAKRGGVSVQTQRKYESDRPGYTRSPDWNYLENVADIADVLYLVTGNRLPNIHAISDQAGVYQLAKVSSDLLQTVIESLDEIIDSENVEMRPDKKAMLITALYDLYADTGRPVDKDRVLRLVKSAT